jgi:asparagine synthase (glutamine-hydrolysing)
MADSSMIPTFLLTRKIKEYCSVALGGDGGDELFGGYNHYSKLLMMDSIISKIPFFLRKKLSNFSEKHIPLGFLGTNIRTYLMLLSTDFNKHIPQSQNLFDRFSINKLLKSHPTFFYEKYEHKKNIQFISNQLINLDFILNYLPDDILVKVDRASMLNSLEIRAPLLDYRVIEFAFGKIPSHLKVSKSEKKIFLKEIAKRILPKEFDFKRKQGFSIPLNSWLIKGKFRDLFWSVLTDESCFFEKNYVLNLLKDQDNGRDNSERLFSLVLFELWRNEYKIDATLS